MTSPATGSANGGGRWPGRWRGRWLPGPAWIGREAVAELFTTQRRLDPLGHRLHTAAGVVACFGAGWPTTVAEWSPLLLLLVFLVRMTEHHRVLRPLWGDRVVWALVGLVGWGVLSLAWTAGTGGEWLDEVAPVLRYAVLPLLLYPVLDRRGWLVGGLIAGVLCGNAAQLVQALDGAGVWPASPWARQPGRVSGWWDPVVGGSVLCAALGLHVGAAALGRSVRERAWGALLVVVTLAAIAATGTRGAWIAAAGVLVVGVGMGVLRRSRGVTGEGFGERAERAWASRRVPLVLGCVLIGVLLPPAAWRAYAQIGERVRQGFDDVRLAVRDARYDSDTGARIGMWEWAWAATACHPVRGVGAGGYRPWVMKAQRAMERGDPETAGRRCGWSGPTAAQGFAPHAHAHSWWLHTAATQGALGLGLLLATVGLGVWSGLRGGAGWCAAGPGLGLAGLALAGVFDTVGVNQQTACWWMVLTALCVPTRPVEGARRA